MGSRKERVPQHAKMVMKEISPLPLFWYINLCLLYQEGTLYETKNVINVFIIFLTGFGRFYRAQCISIPKSVITVFIISLIGFKEFNRAQYSSSPKCINCIYNISNRVWGVQQGLMHLSNVLRVHLCGVVRGFNQNKRKRIPINQNTHVASCL